ncbi:hypothetical protein J4Q44_G00161600 [Coregonus suidteri]|uniref:Ig-like domain-containing protein n=1 Tax=Coregonus suidteri TaxID=861788 RepID=A0AAN8QVW9_9TELE
MIIQLCSVFLSLTLASSVYSETNSPASPPAYTAETELGDQNRVLASHGSNVTLPCRLHRQHGISFGSVGMRIKWTKLSADESLEEDILVSMGFHKKSYGSFQGRVHLLEANDDDASLVLSDVSLDDMGKFRCEVIDGIDDVIHEVTLEVLGSVGYSDGKSFYLYFCHQLCDGRHLIILHFLITPLHFILSFC